MDQKREPLPHEVFDPYQLSFDQLREVYYSRDSLNLTDEQFKKAYDVARRTFKRTDRGVQNVEGEGITIALKGGLWVVETISEMVKKAIDSHRTKHTAAFPKRGMADKEALLLSIQTTVEELGYRIIE